MVHFTLALFETDTLDITVPLTEPIQFRRMIRDYSHSRISPLTGIALTHAFINFFRFGYTLI